MFPPFYLVSPATTSVRRNQLIFVLKYDAAFSSSNDLTQKAIIQFQKKHMVKVLLFQEPLFKGQFCRLNSSC